MNRFHNIRRATEDDIFFIQALEMDPASVFVHSWSQEAHEENLRNSTYDYLIAEDLEGTALGYTILRDDGPQRTEWVRIIVARRGDGIGSAFMQAVLDDIFSRKKSKAIWLDVYEQNDRAIHVYEKLGFVKIGEDLTKVPGERLLIMECCCPPPA